VPTDERLAMPTKGGAGLLAEVKATGMVLGGGLGVMWIVQIVNAVLGGALFDFGVHPRSLLGLLGILFAPFLHANFAHLIANTIPLAVLGFFVMLRRKRDLAYVSASAALVGGLGTWLIAPSNTVHAGASVLVFGYLGYLLFRGIFEKRFWSIVGSVVVFLLYGTVLFGVLPGQIGISWQGHLFGLLGGILAARLMKQPKALATEPVEARPERARIAAPSRALPDDDDVDEELEAARAKLRGTR